MSTRVLIGRSAALATMVGLLLALPSAAPASRAQLTIFQDDRALLLSGAAKRERALNEIAALGADTLHTIVGWSSIAPNPSSRRVPRADLSDPANYPAGAWARLDALVTGATSHGLELILAPAGPIPRWASRCPRGSAHELASCRPDPKLFQAFVTALGRRYSGTFASGAAGASSRPAPTPMPGCSSTALGLAPCPPAMSARATTPTTTDTLPRIHQWSIWNEPNQPGWLRPQYSGHGRSLTPVSPVLYRSLLRAGISGLQASGHGSD
ncbi:MAG TPA: hypothetical protein VGN69_07575, partial [Solirubrobacteraceae bacterium]|nr:hypothetical protein [Solirubrobacteraceae bacterium]